MGFFISANQTHKLIVFLMDLPWSNMLAHLWDLGKRVMGKLVNPGMYEVLEYESILELIDEKGKHARFHKRQKVRYLQDNIIAYQDQAWGDGEILLDYRCSPGMAVDCYRPGLKTFILISLREVKHEGDIDEFNIEWGIRDGFLRSEELWETEINHPTNHLEMKLVFPKTRTPRRVSVLEGNRRRSTLLDSDAQRELPDGRWQVSWEIKRPRLHEHYIIKWYW